MKRLALAPLLLFSAACSDVSTQVVCSGTVRPSVMVNVVDPASNTSVSREASGTWSTGTLGDSLRHVQGEGGDVLLAAFGPSGTYLVRVARPGHADWIRGDVVVQKGVCGPEPAALTAQHATGS